MPTAHEINTYEDGVYREDWETTLQAQLDAPLFWKEIARVDYTNVKLLHNPYSDDPEAQDYTRDGQYTFQPYAVRDDVVDIDQTQVVPEFIDRADEAQTSYSMQMDRADRQGRVLNEVIERAVTAEHANAGLTVDAEDTGGSAGTSVSLDGDNVDEVTRRIRTKLIASGAGEMLRNNGGFILWDPYDFEKVVAYAQNNGFRVADDALSNGVVAQFMGMRHYESNFLDSTSSVRHGLAGVNGAIHVGILNTTYGNIVVDDKDPENRSGTGITSRIDYKTKVWENMKDALVDVNISV